MFIQLRTMAVQKGYSEQVAARFTKDGPMDEMNGLIDRTVMVNTRGREQDEVVVMIRWESQEDWKNWEKSDAHLQGHRDKKAQEPPAYMISTTVKMYEVQAVKPGKASSSTN